MSSQQVRGRTFRTILTLCLLSFLPTVSRAAEVPTGTISDKQWNSASRAPLKAGEIDQLIEKYATKKAPLTTDEQFVRRVYLDLTGNLPYPADVTEFIADKNPNKRAKLIDKLLDSNEFAKHWARYWRNVIGARLLDRRGQALGNSFEAWMTKELKKSTSWAEIATAMLTASGPARFDDREGKTGANYFLGSHVGNDAVVEQTAETSRVFLGIQINCAQCHDHPSDVWKREQFHEMAAFFARLRQRPLRDGQRIVGLQMVSVPFRGEYRMPDLKNPRESHLTHPKTLDGTAPGRGLRDDKRRDALAEWIVSKKNPWFAAAFVNRAWTELMGQGFYPAIDDLGPAKEAVLPEVITRVSGSFKGSNYDVKQLFRDILNTKTYQRQARLGESYGTHLQFAASYPKRLQADALWDSLERTLGKLQYQYQGRTRRPTGPYAARFGLEGQFKEEFEFDPSLKSEDVEGSVPQALMLMNNPLINSKIQANGTNLLGRILTYYKDDSDALKMVYLRALARKPTDRELEKCLTYLKKVGNRKEAFEDILWALVNSTEYQTKK